MRSTALLVATVVVTAMAGCGAAADPAAKRAASSSVATGTTTTSPTSTAAITPTEEASSPTPTTAAEIIDAVQAEVTKVEDKRTECTQQRPDDRTCDREHVQLAMDVGRDALRSLSNLTGPGVRNAIAVAGQLASPTDGVACVETQDATSCIFASPDAFRAARALQRELAALERSL